MSAGLTVTTEELEKMTKAWCTRSFADTRTLFVMALTLLFDKAREERFRTDEAAVAWIQHLVEFTLKDG